MAEKNPKKEKEPKIQTTEKIAEELNEPKEKVEIGPLGKDGERMMKSLESGNMVAVLSGTEIMYVFIFQKAYQCFIHPIGDQEGRHKAWPINDRNRAMLKNLDSAADQLFEIRFKPGMDYMGVMFAAERGIYNFLCTIGQTPGEDIDFMEELQKAKEGANDTPAQ